MCQQIVIKLPDIRFNKNPFSDSRIIVYVLAYKFVLPPSYVMTVTLALTVCQYTYTTTRQETK